MLTKTESWKRRRTERRKDFPPIQFQSMVDTLFPTRTQKVIQPDDTTTARPLVNLQKPSIHIHISQDEKVAQQEEEEEEEEPRDRCIHLLTAPL